MSILVIAEPDGQSLKRGSLSALQFARELSQSAGEGIAFLTLGSEIDGLSRDAARYAGVIEVSDDRLADPIAERLSVAIAAVAKERGAQWIVTGASTWSKDIVGRAAGLLGGSMASDVVGHEVSDGEIVLKRPMRAGEVIAKVVLRGSVKIVTVRNSGYEAAEPAAEPATIERFDAGGLNIPMGTSIVRAGSKSGDRPDPTEASVVISGGRAFKSTEEYEQNVGALADKIGAAVGASRALVDEGLVPNELQIGQTGKIVAPDLYLALGLSGAIQHLAGISNSKVIAAVNRDPEAPIFSVADYGMIGDVHEVVPELIEKLS